MQLPFIKAKPVIRYFATAFGHVPYGLGCSEVYYNLFEDQFGGRYSSEYLARELIDSPKEADFSAKVQVDAWLHGGPLPLCLFDAKKAVTKKAVH